MIRAFGAHCQQLTLAALPDRELLCPTGRRPLAEVNVFQDLHQAHPGSIRVAGNGNFAALGPTKSK